MIDSFVYLALVVPFFPYHLSWPSTVRIISTVIIGPDLHVPLMPKMTSFNSAGAFFINLIAFFFSMFVSIPLSIPF